MADINAKVTIALDSDGDLAISTSSPSISFLSGLDAVTQQVKLALQLFKESWFLDLDAGTDWDAILGERYDERKVYGILQVRLLSLPNVQAINNLTLDFSAKTRELKGSFDIVSVFGTVEGITL